VPEVTEVLVVADEVREAMSSGRGVVALETSVIGQGLPAPRNEECVQRMGAAIREAGAVPAWVGAIDGRLVVGLDAVDLERFCTTGAATKVARRDLPVATATRALGATTVSATIWAAAAAGVRVGATGGIGGVHPGPDPDVSADLLELARTPGLLVCSGPKSIIDPVATVERLEELGVALVGLGVDRLPFFLAREAPVELEHRVDTAAEAAGMLAHALKLGIGSTLVLCHPVPASHAMDADEVAGAAARAEDLADAAGAFGKARTPFLLAALAQLTDGRSLEANLALLEDNARVAAQVADTLTTVA
jgi:pseudouridine-5'-phosphate glycosidase